MSSLTEVVLAEIPDQIDDHRLVLVHCRDHTGSRLELRQQTWGEGIGWFTQNSVRLLPEQVGQLRAALGSAPSGRIFRAAAPSRAAGASHLRLAHAESA